MFKARLRKWEKPTESRMRVGLVLGDASANSVDRGHATAQATAPQERDAAKCGPSENPLRGGNTTVGGPTSGKGHLCLSYPTSGVLGKM